MFFVCTTTCIVMYVVQQCITRNKRTEKVPHKKYKNIGIFLFEAYKFVIIMINNSEKSLKIWSECFKISSLKIIFHSTFLSINLEVTSETKSLSTIKYNLLTKIPASLLRRNKNGYNYSLTLSKCLKRLFKKNYHWVFNS